MSSAKIKDGWLSDDACRCGVSRPGVPALLIGLEKLKDGLGNEATELIEGDLWYGWKLAMAGDDRPVIPKLLPPDIFRAGWEWNEALKLSLWWYSSGCDMMLEERLGNRVLGGARPESCDTCLLNFSGDGGSEAETGVVSLNDASLEFASSSIDLLSVTRSVSPSRSLGDCSLLKP